MVKDYSERRQMRASVPPRKSSLWPYILFVLFLLTAYGAGVATGWFLYRPGGRLYKIPSVPTSDKKEGAGRPKQEQNDPAASSQPPEQKPGKAASGAPSHEKADGPPPLTFYNTLQKGNKGLMGTGINQPKEGQPPATPKPAPPQTPER